MRNRFIQSLLLLFLISISNAQSTWQYFHKNANEEEQIVSIEEIQNDDIVTVSHVIHVNSDENKAKGIIRFHQKETGEVYRTQEYKVDSLATKFEKLYYNKSAQTFTIIGSAYHKGVNKNGVGYKRGYLLITHWDYDLNLLKDTVIALEPFGANNYLWFIDGNRCKNGDLLLMGISTTHLTNFKYNRKVLYLRLDKTGNIIRKKWYQRHSYGTYTVSLIENQEQNGYIAIGITPYFLNRDFEKLDSFATNDTYSHIPRYNCTAKIFSKDKFLINIQFENNRNKGLAMFDANFNIIDKINISRPYSVSDIVEDFPIARRNFDYIDTSTIFVGAQDIYYKNHTLAKVNSKLEPIWIKYLSKDDTLGNLVWTMKATNDGGCILVGSQGKYRKYNLPEGRGAWMKKFGADGNSVSTKNITKKSWEITVFPNPSSGDFKLEIVGNSKTIKLQLFDIQGRKMKGFNNLIRGINNLNMHDLPYGIYIWKLEKEGKIIGDGKWVKK